jgi:hypothetical protein
MPHAFIPLLFMPTPLPEPYENFYCIINIDLTELKLGSARAGAYAKKFTVKLIYA